MSFDEDTALRAVGDGVWEGAIASGWDTPRGPLGGYVMAIVLRALELAAEDPEAQRAVCDHALPAPARVGEASVHGPPGDAASLRRSPFTRSERGETGGWLGCSSRGRWMRWRWRSAPTPGFPPWPRLVELAPAPTVDLTLHFRTPLPVPDCSLLLCRFRSRLVRDGFFEEHGGLWAPDGSLVAQSRQLGVLIGARA